MGADGGGVGGTDGVGTVGGDDRMGVLGCGFGVGCFGIKPVNE